MGLRIWQPTPAAIDTTAMFGQHWKAFGSDQPTPDEVLTHLDSAVRQEEHLIFEHTESGRRFLVKAIELPFGE